MISLSALVGSMQQEAWILVHVMRRDTAKRLSTLFFITMVCLHSGQTAPSLINAAGILVVEAVVYFGFRKGVAQDRPTSANVAVMLLAARSANTVQYIYFGAILANQPSMPLMIMGLLWLSGTLIHTANAYHAAPSYNSLLVAPSMLGAVITILAISAGSYVEGSQVDWWLMWMGVGIFALNTRQTMTAHKDTYNALSTARREATQRLQALERISSHDPLTGLLNRRAFDEQLVLLLEESRCTGRRAGAFLIDLDGFKPINDSYSHEAGDVALRTIADRLRQAAGDEGRAARLGGDEFAIAFPSVGDARTADRLARRLLREFAVAIPYGEVHLQVTASIGIALAGRASDTVTTLLNEADQAMYRAKAEGKNTAVIFDAALFPPRPTLQDRSVLAASIQEGEICPHYQPKVRLCDGRLIGFEALARWLHPDRGLLSPAQFLPQIAELGLTAAFTGRILRRVLEDMEELMDAGLDPGRISVNLPEISLSSVTGRQEVEMAFAAYPRAVRTLTVEITEDVFIGRSRDVVAASIAAFRQTGARVSLDDFGTGFASFQNLRQLDYDELKIDRSFVAGLGTDPTADVLVGSFLSMARGLGVDVIAEGIETEAQRQRLIAMGCRHGQGYLFGRAVGREEMEVRLAAEGVWYDPGAADQVLVAGRF